MSRKPSNEVLRTVWEAETAEARRQSSEVVQLREQRDALERALKHHKALLAECQSKSLELEAENARLRRHLNLRDAAFGALKRERNALKAKVAELETESQDLRRGIEHYAGAAQAGLERIKELEAKS